MGEGVAHLRLGAEGEEAAACFLRGLGWTLLERNWRPAGAARGLELDIVAKDGDVLVFVEVKTRGRQGADRRIPAYAAFTPRKRAKLVCAARHFLAARGLWQRPCRFDFISVERSIDGGFTVEHQPHVIEIGNALGRGDASWQPW